METIIRPVSDLRNHYQLKAELDLLSTLAGAEEDVTNGREAPIKETFDNLRVELQARKNR